MKRRVPIFALALATGLSLASYPVLAHDTDKDPAAKMKSGRTAAETISNSDFVSKAQAGTQFEISAAKLAVDKSQNKDIKNFAERMVHDHTKIGDDLKKVLASASDASLPKDTPMNADMQRKLQQLEASTGKNFDTSFVSMMFENHQDNAKLFKDFEKTTTDPKLKGFAQRTLPIIEAHLNAIEKIQRAEKAG